VDLPSNINYPHGRHEEGQSNGSKFMNWDTSRTGRSHSQVINALRP
jgi:hypothetical protein